MAITLSANVSSIIRATYQNPLGIVSYNGNLAQDFELPLSSSAVSKLYAATRSTTGETIDLTSTLTDGFGNTLNFGSVKHIQIVNNDATKTLAIGGGANGVFGALPTLTAGGCYNLTTTLTVDGTHKLLVVTPSSGTISYTLVIVGS